ncbi:putative CBP80/20-dependent translation initiation factor, partial [Triplophysa rosa]
RRGMESISLWHCSGVMRAQVALIVAFSSSALLGLAYRIFLFTIPHRFSMGLRSGEFAGQLRTGIPWSLNQLPPFCGPVAMETSSVASASSEAGSTRSQEIEELERFIDSYVLEYQVQGLLNDKSDTDQDVDKTPSHASQWAEDCSDKVDGSWSSSRGRGSSKPDEWEHSSNGSTGSRPSSGSQHGSGSRSGSRGQNNQFRAKNGNRDCALDILGTDIWAANLDCHGGATWDMQPEKLDFSQFHMRPYRGTPKHLPHIDREGMMKGTFDDDDNGIDLESMNKFLPTLPHPGGLMQWRCEGWALGA